MSAVLTVSFGIMKTVNQAVIHQAVIPNVYASKC